jgi:anti-sigma factor RsiW
MAEQHCIYPERDSVLVAYLYDDIDTIDRVAFDRHIATCEPCRSELAELLVVRSRLAEWAAPESASRSHQSPVAGRQSRWWHDIPAWAQVAAALLVLGVSASIANLDVRYDRASGLSVRTGWSTLAPATPVAVAPVADANPTPWRDDLAALQKQLHDEIHAQSAAVTAASTANSAMSDTDFRRRVSAILDESDQKQKTDFAAKLVQLQKDVYLQQQIDISRVYRTLGVMQTNTSNEMANQRRAISLAIPPK